MTNHDKSNMCLGLCLQEAWSISPLPAPGLRTHVLQLLRHRPSLSWGKGPRTREADKRSVESSPVHSYSCHLTRIQQAIFKPPTVLKSEKHVVSTQNNKSPPLRVPESFVGSGNDLRNACRKAWKKLLKSHRREPPLQNPVVLKTRISLWIW